jgi:hypothetical protein
VDSSLVDYVEKEDIKMRYIGTERQLTNIFIKLIDSSQFVDLGGLVFTIRIAWFDGKLVFYLIYCIFYFSLVSSLYSSMPLCFTDYTSLYLLNYVYHCARISSNEM